MKKKEDTPNKQRQLVQMISEIATENDIKIRRLSHDWIIQLSKNGKQAHILGYNFEINTATAQLIANDKSATSDLLAVNNVPSVEHKLFLNRSDYIGENGNWINIIDYAKVFDYQLVAKATKGTGGNNVFKIHSASELEKAVQKLFVKSYSLCLSPLYAIKNEYRIIVLEQNVELIYKKQIPYIVGNGENTILELLLEKFKNSEISNDIINFATQFDTNNILAKNEKLLLNWKHNLGKGAMPKFIEEESLKNKLADLAKKATKAIQINFASVDIIETNDNQFLVLEINSGIMIENFVRTLPHKYEFIKSIYRKAVFRMLNMPEM
ncbi:MAG: ATP-grasp domain-containing protein [Chitinophagales bacterium]